jgi:hypothetical protein
MSDRRWSWPFVIGVNALAVVSAWAAAASWARAVARMLGAARLVEDFTSLKIGGASDVDGW